MELNAHQAYLIQEFVDEYHEHRLNRRDLLKRTLLITGSIPFAAVALSTFGCGANSSEERASATSAPATTAPTTAPKATATAAASAAPAGTSVPATDPAIEAADIRFPGPAGELIAYTARPKAAGAYPGILVIHENRGLVEHTKDVARRYAKEGFAALAVDLVSRGGGTQADANANPGFLGRAAPDDLIADLKAGLAYLKAQSYVRPTALGVTGFCFGGGYTWETAIANPEVKAAVPYYGTVRLMDQLSKTNAAILAIYGGNDARVTGQAPTVEENLKAAGKTYQIKIYEGANHAFFNDTGANYNQAAALDAWVITLAWFRRHLG